MEHYAIPISAFAGVLFYWYVAWLAPDRDTPKDVNKALRGSLGLLGVSLALLVFLVLPWSIFEGWSITQVATADLPHAKMRTAVYAIYAAAVAGALGILHALVAALVSRAKPSVGG